MATMAAQAQVGGGGYHHHHHHPATLEEVRTLWIGDLQYWVDENYLNSCFAHTGEVVSVKVIRNKITAQPEGYGFVEFVSHGAAERVLQTYNGTPMPGTEQLYRLNWASFGIGGDLMLGPSIQFLGAKVVTDPNTGRSKGYGFVKFLDENERNRAMTEMNGVFCSTRPMRISAATPKKTTGVQQYAAAAKAIYPYAAYTTPVQVLPVVDNDINNTTIFVGNLDPNITEEELKQTFLHFGEIVYVKIPVGRGCGFVQFSTRASAEEAIQRMQGHMIGQQQVRVSWGRKQDLSGSLGAQVDPNQWNAYYGYGQGYDAYAYGASQDPSLYAYGAYAGYPQYAQQVEGTADMAAIVDQREESYDPLVPPDVDKLNAAYLSVHGNAILGRTLWLRTSSVSQQA